MSCWGRAKLLLQHGYPVLLICCRAHGDSTGEFNDVGWSARHDIVAAVNWLRTRRPNDSIIVWGTSLGSAAAVFAADELQSTVHGYILECPYRDLNTAVWNRLQMNLPPLIDRVCYCGMCLSALAILPEMPQISLFNRIPTIPQRVPVLILAGEADQRARPEEAQALHTQIKGHSQLVIFPKADHLRLQQAAPQEYEKQVFAFLQEIQ